MERVMVNPYQTIDDYIIAIRAYLISEYCLPLTDVKTMIDSFPESIRLAYGHAPNPRAVSIVADEIFSAFATKELGYIPDAPDFDVPPDTPMGLENDNPIEDDYDG